jgi:hypothetical protein
MLDLLLSRPENVGRETPIAITAAVLIKPAGSINSVRMKSPGWACHSEQNSRNSASPGRPAFVEFCTPPQSWRGTDGQPNLGDGGRVDGRECPYPCKPVSSFAYQGFWHTAESL